MDKGSVGKSIHLMHLSFEKIGLFGIPVVEDSQAIWKLVRESGGAGSELGLGVSCGVQAFHRDERSSSGSGEDRRIHNCLSVAPYCGYSLYLADRCRRKRWTC